MADTKISGLSDGAPAQAGDQIPINRAGSNFRIAVSAIRTLFDTFYDAINAASTAVSTHEAAADPHVGYQKESEKDAASGYAGLSAGSKLAGTQQTYGAAANTATEGNDSRLSDARTPTAHHATHEPGGSDPMVVDAAAVTGSLRTIGTTSLKACAGDDARLSDARTPTAHAITHKSGGSDAIKLDELAAPTDITTLNADTAKHGLMQKYPGGTTTFLRADGAFAAPPAGGGAVKGTATVDFGATPVDTKVFVVTDAALAGLTYVHAYIMGDDSTVDNNAAMHKQAGGLMRLSCETPSGSNMNVNADILAGRVTGQFKLRYMAA